MDMFCFDVNLSGDAWYTPNIPFYAAQSGKVVGVIKGEPDKCNGSNNNTANCGGGCAGGNCGGNFVVIDCDPTGELGLLAELGYRYCGYSHLQTGSNDHLSIGDTVVKGAQLGKVGSSGQSTAPHLHFEVGKSFD